MFRGATACFPFFRSAHGDHAHTCNSRWHNELRTSLRASMNQKNSPLECEAENASGQYVKGSQTTLFLLALCMSWIKFHTILWSIRVVRSHLEAGKQFVLLWMQSRRWYSGFHNACWWSCGHHDCALRRCCFVLSRRGQTPRASLRRLLALWSHYHLLFL